MPHEENVGFNTITFSESPEIIKTKLMLTDQDPSVFTGELSLPDQGYSWASFTLDDYEHLRHCIPDVNPQIL